MSLLHTVTVRRTAAQKAKGLLPPAVLELAVARCEALQCGFVDYLGALVYKDYSNWVKEGGGIVPSTTKRYYEMMSKLGDNSAKAQAVTAIIEKTEFLLKDPDMSTRVAAIAFEEGVRALTRSNIKRDLSSSQIKDCINKRTRNDKLEAYVKYNEATYSKDDIISDLDNLEDDKEVSFLQYQAFDGRTFRRDQSPATLYSKGVPHLDVGRDTPERIGERLAKLLVPKNT